MPSSISSSDRDPGFDPARLHHAPLSPGLRLTASDRPGVAQPVPGRDVPPLPWAKMALAVLALLLSLTAIWEWRMRELGLIPGDLGEEASGWAEQRRRIDREAVPIALVGDSRILFDTDLDRFHALTGIRPVQLALAGTNGRPFLEDLADDPDFKGLAIVGITEASYFRPGIGRGRRALDRGHYESPAQRVSYLLHVMLARRLAMLDANYRLSTIVAQIDPNWRPGVRGPYGDVWKLIESGPDRQSALWREIETNDRLRAHAIKVWMGMFSLPGPKPDVIAMTYQRTRAAVAKIRARGGDVVFLRPPSAPPVRALEERALPRRIGWDGLLQAARVRGVHVDDVPDAQGLILPEYSHLNRACATVFTDAYVRALARVTPRIGIVQGAPPALRPVDCTKAPARAQPSI